MTDRGEGSGGAGLVDAMVFAAEQHRHDVRKGSGDPYVVHLIEVCARTAMMGGSVIAQTAALLHDVVEDHDVSIADVASRFGTEVARVVELCSDTEVQPKPPWIVRKVAYVERLRAHTVVDPPPTEYLCVTLADKLANASSILRDVAQHGDSVYDRFVSDEPRRDESKHLTLAYYADIAHAFAHAPLLPPALRLGSSELTAIVEELGATPQHTLIGN